jgi:hypothetical protein
MGKQGFRAMLEGRKVPADKLDSALALAERFELFLEQAGGEPDAETAWAFCQTLIQEGQNTYDNLITLARYGRFTKNDEIYVAVLELLDGEEAQRNLYREIGELFGEALREEVFAGIGVAPLGTPSTDKPHFMFPVIERLVAKLGRKKIATLLSGCLRDLPDTYYRNERRRFLRARDIDDYLGRRHRAFVRTLRKCQRQGQLFFVQEVTDEVMEYVKGNAEIESGVRDGSVLYVSKIPYNTKQFLAETDPTMKRYYACHCPWAREAIKSGDVKLDPIFCNCSGGFSKKPWEVIFGETLEVEVLESVLLGDMRCRFAIHLPEDKGRL